MTKRISSPSGMTERYLNHRGLGLSITHPTFITTPLLPKFPTSMSYYSNHKNLIVLVRHGDREVREECSSDGRWMGEELASYSTTSTAGDFDGLQFPDQPQATDPLNYQAHNVPTDCWDGPGAGSPTSDLGTAGFSRYRCNLFSDSCLMRDSSDPVAGATSYSGEFDSYSQPSPADPCWPAVGKQPHPEHAGFSGRGTFHTSSTMAAESCTVISTPSSGDNLLCTFEELNAQWSLFYYFIVIPLTDHEQCCSTTGGRTRAAP